MSDAETRIEARTGGLSGLPFTEGEIALLRGFLDTIPGRVVAVGPDHRYLYVNREFLDHFGLTLDEVVGRHPREVVGEAAYERQGAAARRAQETREAIRWEGWLAYPDGSRRFIQQIVAPLIGAGDEVAALVSYGRDLTNLREQERVVADGRAALEASEALNAAVVASALDCVVVIDEAGRCLEFNPTAERTFGRRREDVLGRPIGDLIVPPALRQRHADGLARYLATGRGAVIGRRVEVEAQHADGHTFPVELAITEIKLADRRLFTAYLRDLTAAKRAAAEIEAQRDRLHHVEKLSAMGSLLAGVAHELNNPLAVVLAQSTLLRDKAPDEAVRRRAERIHAAAERSARIVKSFLAMARQKQPRREPCDLNEIAAGALELTAYGRRSAGIEIEVALAPDLPRMEADPDLVGQVVANLLLNAQQVLVDRAGPRRIRLATGATEGGVALRVEDNGPGVPPDLRDKIFQPYFTTKPVGVGTGIGLSICKSVIQAHGGRIDLSDRPGGGAVFGVVLPAAERGAAPAEGKGGSLGGAGLSVLVVDDEMDVGRSLADLLEGLGHRVRAIDAPERALDLLREQPFDLVFADLRMPGLSGVELRARIRERHPRLASRVVIVTGDTVAGPEVIAGRPGEEQAFVLEKPFTVADVEAAVTRVAGSHGAASPQRSG